MQCFPGVEPGLFGLMFSSCDEVWTSENSHRENPVSQCVDGQGASRKVSKERGRFWENISIFPSIKAGSPFKYYWEVKKRQSWLLVRSLGTDASHMTRTVWSTPTTDVLGRRKKTSSQRDGGYRTSDCYLPTAQKVISPTTLRVSYIDLYFQPTPKCLCRRELLSNFSFVAIKARGLVQVSKLFSVHRPPLHCITQPGPSTRAGSACRHQGWNKETFLPHCWLRWGWPFMVVQDMQWARVSG